MGKRKFQAPYRLGEDLPGAMRRQCQYNILATLNARTRKFFDNNEQIEDVARAKWELSDYARDGKDQKGYPVLRQTIRNALKHQKSDNDDLLTRGLLIALVDGGAALPGHIPPMRVAKKIPHSNLGFDPPRVNDEPKDEPKRKKKKPASDLKQSSGDISARKIAESYILHIKDAHQNPGDVLRSMLRQIADEIETD